MVLKIAGFDSICRLVSIRFYKGQESHFQDGLSPSCHIFLWLSLLDQVHFTFTQVVSGVITHVAPNPCYFILDLLMNLWIVMNLLSFLFLPWQLKQSNDPLVKFGESMSARLSPTAENLHDSRIFLTSGRP